ncbi:TPA: hypothetical protein QCW96_004662 [Bacillus pacificus]|uniref:hypothetical protein n=1 Tax=Bacillus cereus group TaxID=86661 RepID=UPI00383CAC3A|nr:hypothetical protein [Bacillus pacificus]
MKLVKKGLIKNKKIKYVIIAVTVILLASFIMYLETLTSKKEEQAAKGGTPQITKSEKEFVTKFIVDFYTFLNENEFPKAQALSQVDLNDIHPGKKENQDEKIELPKAYSINKLTPSKYKVVGLEKIKLDTQTVGKRKSTYLIEEKNSKYYITKFSYTFEKEMLEPEIKLIGQNMNMYSVPHGKVELIGEAVDDKQKRFTVAIKYTGSKPEQFVHTFTSVGDMQNSNNLNLLYGISDNGVKLFPDQTEVRRIDGDVVVLFSGDAKEEKLISRIDYAQLESINKVLAGEIQLDKDQVKEFDDYIPLNISGTENNPPIILPEQNHLNIDIKPDFEKKTDSTTIHIDSITYDNTKGMQIKGYAVNNKDAVINIEENVENTDKKVDQIKVYSPYQYQMINFDTESIYEKNLYQNINSAFLLKSKVKLTDDDYILKLNLFNVTFGIDLKTGKEVQLDENNFKSLDVKPNFIQ